jgi:hypothetical protein
LKVDTVINRQIPRYPAVYPTSIDLMPLMSFQQALDPDLQVSMLSGAVSVSLGQSTDKFESKEHDITYRVNRQNPRKTDVEFDSESLQDTIKQTNFWSQVKDDLGAEFAELNIDTRVPILKTPSSLELEFDSIVKVEQKSGHFTSSLRRRFNLHGIRSPYRIIKYELQERELWTPEYARKLRGVLKMQNLAGLDTDCPKLGVLKGWTKFLKPPPDHRFPPLANTLNKELMEHRWWQDVGLPVRMLGSINSREVEAIVYMLRKRRNLITA